MLIVTRCFNSMPSPRILGLKGTWLVVALCLLGDARETDILSAQLTEVDRPVPRVDKCRLKQCGKTEQQCKEDGTTSDWCSWDLTMGNFTPTWVT